MLRVMVVEDDAKLGRLVVDSLACWGFESSLVSDDGLKDVLGAFVAGTPQLVLMDVNLPYFDGFHWCRLIREVSQVPIIFISSRDSDMDVVMAINMGADDFIQKPFSMEVLVAKVKAAARRAYSYAAAPSSVTEHRGVILNHDDATLLYDGRAVELSRNEFRIAKTLLDARGAIVTRNQLMDALWDGGDFVDDNTLTVNVSRLRRRLAEMGLPEFIETRKGQGYSVP